MVITLAFLLLLRIIFDILGFLPFQILNLRIAFSMSLKNCVGILMGIALNLHIAFGRMAIFTMLILPIHEHGRPLHFLRSSSISFLRDLELLSSSSFTFLVRVTPRYFILFVAIVKGVVHSLFIISIEEGYLFIWVNFISHHFAEVVW